MIYLRNLKGCLYISHLPMLFCDGEMIRFNTRGSRLIQGWYFKSPTLEVMWFQLVSHNSFIHVIFLFAPSDRKKKICINNRLYSKLNYANFIRRGLIKDTPSTCRFLNTSLNRNHLGLPVWVPVMESFYHEIKSRTSKTVEFTVFNMIYCENLKYIKHRNLTTRLTGTSLMNLSLTPTQIHTSSILRLIFRVFFTVFN